MPSKSKSAEILKEIKSPVQNVGQVGSVLAAYVMAGPETAGKLQAAYEAEGMEKPNAEDDDFVITGEGGTLRRGPDGFTSFHFGDKTMGLNPKQTAIAELLWNARKHGTDKVRKVTLLKAAGCDPIASNVGHLFRTGDGKLFYELLVQPDPQGNYRLKI